MKMKTIRLEYENVSEVGRQTIEDILSQAEKIEDKSAAYPALKDAISKFNPSWLYDDKDFANPDSVAYTLCQLTGKSDKNITSSLYMSEVLLFHVDSRVDNENLDNSFDIYVSLPEDLRERIHDLDKNYEPISINRNEFLAKANEQYIAQTGITENEMKDILIGTTFGVDSNGLFIQTQNGYRVLEDPSFKKEDPHTLERVREAVIQNRYGTAALVKNQEKYNRLLFFESRANDLERANDRLERKKAKEAAKNAPDREKPFLRFVMPNQDVYLVDGKPEVLTKDELRDAVLSGKEVQIFPAKEDADVRMPEQER